MAAALDFGTEMHLWTEWVELGDEPRPSSPVREGSEVRELEELRESRGAVDTCAMSAKAVATTTRSVEWNRLPKPKPASKAIVMIGAASHGTIIGVAQSFDILPV